MSGENCSLRGFRFSAVAAGVKHPGTARLDVGLIVADAPCELAGVTTTNIVAAAPVRITRERLATGMCQAVLANSGNANACTGEQGVWDAHVLMGAVADALGINEGLIVPLSTGVIGNPLPVERILTHIPPLIEGLDERRATDVARAIMTTDTRPKLVKLQQETSAGPFTILGLAKGAGMIAPNMATMLAVLLTDMRVPQRYLQDCLRDAVNVSFNRVTIDGDTSTNDTALLLAGGKDDALRLPDSGRERQIFADAVRSACLDLARQLVLDGEGVTKAVEVRVVGAPNEESARAVARTVADSMLVKTAFHGEDPNWGRILAAAGRAGVIFNPDAVSLFIGSVPILKEGRLSGEDWESAAREVMKQTEFSILLDLGAGGCEATMLTTDLSEEYVGINADYRS